MPIEQQLLIAALTKWAIGEPQTIADFRRIMQLVNTIPVAVQSVSVDEEQALHAEWRQVLNARYINVPSS